MNLQPIRRIRTETPLPCCRETCKRDIRFEYIKPSILVQCATQHSRDKVKWRPFNKLPSDKLLRNGEMILLPKTGCASRASIRALLTLR